MGNYRIIINGLGAHHNKNNKGDADKMAFQFVNELKAAGHTISEAVFLSNYREDNLLKIGGSFSTREIPKGGNITALTLEQVKEIEEDKIYSGDAKMSSWNNENFRKLLDTVKALYTELEERN